MKFDQFISWRNLKWCLAIPLLGISSCKILLESPEKQAPISSRYQKMNASVNENDSSKARVIVIVKSDLLPDTPPVKKNLLNFSGEGQKALIDAYNGRAHSTDELNGMIGANYFQDDDNSNVIDFTTRTVSLTISVQNRDFFGGLAGDSSFADRLEKIRFRLALDQKDVFKFTSWNKINTQFGKFYVGNRTYTGSQTATISPSIPIGAASLSLGSFAGTNQYAESDTISEQYISSNGILHNDNFIIEQDGTPKTTLMGNTIVQITVKAKNTDSKHAIVLDNLTGEDGKPAASEKVKLTQKTVLFAIFAKNADGSKNDTSKLTAKLSFDYVLRHINHGFRTFAESDDEITYYYGTVKDQPVDILGPKDLGLKLFYLTIDGQFIKLRNTTIADPDEQFTTTDFLSNDEALAFLRWLLAQPDSNSEIKIGAKYQVGILNTNGTFKLLTKNYMNNHKLLIKELENLKQ